MVDRNRNKYADNKTNTETFVASERGGWFGARALLVLCRIVLIVLPPSYLRIGSTVRTTKVFS